MYKIFVFEQNIIKKGMKKMPKLKCEVGQCVYNVNRLCSRGSIDVEGPGARSKKETACLSYIQRGNNAYEAEFARIADDVKPETHVYCDATNCVYERDSICRADKIEIKNESLDERKHHGEESKYHEGFWKSAETMCQTFEAKDNK